MSTNNRATRERSPGSPVGVFTEYAAPEHAAGSGLLQAMIDATRPTDEEATERKPAPGINTPGLRHWEVAKRVGKTPSAVSSWLSGARHMTVNRLAELAGALGFQLRLVAVPVRNGVAVPTLAERDRAVVTRLEEVLARHSDGAGVFTVADLEELLHPTARRPRSEPVPA